MAERAAVVIGINYAHLPPNLSGAAATRAGLNPLQYAEADADEMAAALREDGYKVVTLVGAGATRKAIIRALRQQSQVAGTDGMLVVYFAGHGDVDPIDSRIAYLLPADVDPDALDETAIPLEDLAQRYLGLVPAALTLLDCCHSGYAVGLRGGLAATDQASDFGQRVQDTFSGRRGRIVLTACAGDKLARELTKLRHGAFTYYLLDWWHRSPDVDEYSLASHVSDALRREGLPLPVRSGLQEGPMELHDRRRPPEPPPPPPPPPPLPPAGSGAAEPSTRQSAPLELPGGTMNPKSPFYVERRADAVAHEALRGQGVTLTIKGPRQVGKSSLLYRLIGGATAAGKRVAYLDFEIFDNAALEQPETFLRQFCSALSRRLKIADQVATYWQEPIGNVQRCSAYLEEYLLPAVGGPLMLAMDEVDRVFETRFSSDFFSMLRSWHNERALGTAWQGVDLVLVTSTEPYQLIENLNQSPFNVGATVEMEDFTPAQVADLNRRHGAPLPAEAETRLQNLIGGQPYLVRQALYQVASGLYDAAGLFAAATADNGPFGPHLRHHLTRLQEKPEQVDGMRRVLRGQPGLDERIFFRLQSAGLVKRAGSAVVPRCQLYAAYFREHLGG